MSGMMGYGGMGGPMGPMMMDPAMIGAQMRQQYAMALMGQGTQTDPIRSPWQALARGVQGTLGGYMEHQGLQQMQQLNQQYAQQRGQGTAMDMAVMARMAGIDPSTGQPIQGAQGDTQQAPQPAAGSVPPTAPQEPKALSPAFDAAAQKTGIPRNVLVRMASAESQFNPAAVNPQSKATGIMQILPSTAANPGTPGMAPISPADLQDPAKNIAFGADYLASRGKQEFGAGWNPTDPGQLRVAMKQYSGNAGYVDNVLSNAAPAPGGAGATIPSNQQDPSTGLGFSRQAWIYYQMKAQAAMSSYDPMQQRMAPFYTEMAKQALNFGSYGPVQEVEPGVYQQKNMNTGQVTFSRPTPTANLALGAIQEGMGYVNAGKPMPPDVRTKYDLAWKQMGYAPETTMTPGGQVLSMPKSLPGPDLVPPDQIDAATAQRGQSIAAPAGGAAAPTPAAGGGAPAAPAPGGGAAAPAPTAPAPAAPAGGAGGVQVQNVPGMVTPAQMDVGKDRIEGDVRQAEELRQAALAGNATMATTDQIRNILASGQVPTGILFPAQLEISRILSGVGSDPATVQKISGMNPELGQLLDKLMTQFSTQKTREMGAREPGSVVNLFMKKYPNPESQPGTIDAFTRSTDMQVLYDQKQSELQQQWIADHSGNVANYKAIGGPEYNAWVKQQGLNPNVYVAAGEMAAKMPHSVWGDGLNSKQDANAAYALARQTYPNVRIQTDRPDPRHPGQFLWDVPRPAQPVS